ncbi:DUF2059 domain-containing protein [Massilia niastensis]|uniref:DUF2059 domain-containing protein n=1 Tax=Massilia niastensis TaxID=544911 RepID=UPI000376AA94|nr:DUF2059 domain-containing protein [Massilia niastensis]
MKKLFAALTAAAAFAGLPSLAAAAPADPQATEAVKAMLDAMQVRQMMASSFVEMEKTMPAVMRAQVVGVIEADPTLSPAKKQEALARAEKMLPGVAQAVSRVFRDPALVDEMLAEMVPLYAKHFTTAEIRELTAFYGTPLGRKMMATMPKLSAESMALSQKLVTPRLGKLMQDVMKDAQQP